MSKLRAFSRSLFELPRKNSGSVLVLFALAMLGLVLVVGLAIDYSDAMSRKQQLNTAADAAALAALGQAESDYVVSKSWGLMQQDAKSAAQSAFTANAGALYALLKQGPTITIARSGQVVTANISYQAKSPNYFGGLAHVANMNLSGSSASSMTLPSYLNFYLLLDVSASMGIPSTASEINRLAAVNPDYLNLYPGGCTIACHFTAYKACQDVNGKTTWCQGFNLSRTGGNPTNTPVSFCPTPGTSACIQLRLDAVAYATQQLIATALSTEARDNLPNQFGIGLYPFIRWMVPLQAITTNLTTVETAAPNLTSLIDNGNGASGGLGSGGTHFENALPAINNVIKTVGDGSNAAKPKPFVFLVTDGAQDNQYQQNNGSWTGSNHATTLDTTNCDTIKQRGITLAVLYVPYVPIPNPTTIWNDEDDYANANIPNIPPSLQACASPGFFFTASSPGDINNAMQTMFRMAVTTAHLTH